MVLVQDVMTHGALSVRLEATAEEAADQLRAHRIGGAPVVDEGKLVGMVSKTDLIGKERDAKISDFMTSYVQFVRPTDAAQLVIDLMLSEGIHRVVVIGSDRRVVGMVTMTDIVRAVQRGDVIHVPPEFPHDEPAAARLEDGGY